MTKLHSANIRRQYYAVRVHTDKQAERVLCDIRQDARFESEAMLNNSSQEAYKKQEDIELLSNCAQSNSELYFFPISS